MPNDKGAIEVKGKVVGRSIATSRSIARTIEEFKRIGVAIPNRKKTDPARVPLGERRLNRKHQPDLQKLCKKSRPPPKVFQFQYLGKPDGEGSDHTICVQVAFR